MQMECCSANPAALSAAYQDIYGRNQANRQQGRDAQVVASHRWSGHMAVEFFFLVDGAPPVFHCDRMAANLSRAACAASYKRCFNLSCQGCPIGAEHAIGASAGDDPLRFPALVLKCIRCGRQANRLIGHGLCVPCLNRHAEVVHGHNAKGAFPRIAARKLFEFSALLSGYFPPRADCQIRSKSQCAPILTRISGGAFVTGIFSSRDEFDRWMTKFHPDTQVVDFEHGRNLSELATTLRESASTSRVVIPT